MKFTSVPPTSFGTTRLLVFSLVITVLAACGEHRTDSITGLPSPGGVGSAQPHLAEIPGGGVVLIWLEPGDDGSALHYSVLQDGQWSNATSVASGNNWFVNWADFPSVVPISKSHWGAHWLRRTPGNSYSYEVVLSMSDDSGKTWSEGIVPHDDGTPTEHGFVSLFPHNGELAALWLDGREMQGQTHDSEDSNAGMTLRSAVLAGDGQVVQSKLVDGLVCDCCQTDVAMTSEGPVAVYRNRSEGEIRDIFVTRLVDDEWTPGFAVSDDGWEIAGCPVNGPSISAGHGLVTVAWFTAADEMPRVQAAFSTDSGRSFGNAVDLDSDSPIGRVTSLAFDSRSSLVAWIAESPDAGARLVALRVGIDGALGQPVTISPIDSGRLAGFPQMARSGDNVVFAWTHVGDRKTSVRTALLQASAFDGQRNY